VTNNDVLRRLRYAFDLNDNKVVEIFALGGLDVSREQMSDWLKKEDDKAYKSCSDIQLAIFLNGFIENKRGKKEGDKPVAEQKITNNIIFKKLNIALNLKSDEVLAILILAGLHMSKHELSAFFRKKGHKHYRECKDQIMRNFLQGLQIQYRPVDNDETPGKEPYLWE